MREVTISDHGGRIMATISRMWSWWLEETDEKDGRAKFILTIFVTAFAVSWYTWVIKKSRKEKLLWLLPPGPPGLPLIGNLPFVEPELQLYFFRLTKIYGPIFRLQLGNKLCVVLNSPSLAKEVMRDHDAVFANRDAPITALTISYGGMDIAWSAYGHDWRIQRRLFVREMMSNTILESYYTLRRQEVRRTVCDIYTKIGTPISIREQMFLTVLNVIMNMIWGGTLKGEERIRVGAEFRRVVEECVELMGKPNISDIFPVIARFDLQGLDRRMKRLLLWFDQIFDSVLDQRRKTVKAEGNGKSQESTDFLQLLMQLLDDEDPKTRITMTHLRALLMDVVVGGTETTSTTVEWALSELMYHPHIMRKVQDELEKVVGKNNTVEESHLRKLHYLDAVLKEVLRLHPVLPLLIPRRPSASCNVGGYTIPKDTRVLVNAWAIHRDPDAWDRPFEFRPERFLTEATKSDFNGNDFRYIPFGSGRRICAGLPLAEKMLMHVLASLLHSFEWALPEGTELDLLEKFGIVIKKSTPLIAIPSPRLSNPQLYAPYATFEI
ncbi:cytochrome P450 71AU50-like [Magnolia sinica]|uniref:cytochrome P450 71AU50-like n=1 Tax=Magnolia sinica TaxID=86752 RepID=UPI002657CB05|nr:cytochrome P450 71AU50-like [Magnolia sinica]